MRAELRDRFHDLVHGRVVDRVHRLHDHLVVAVGAPFHDVLRLFLEEPERHRGEGDAAGRADGQREEALAALGLFFVHGGESSKNVAKRSWTVAPQAFA